MDLGNEYPWSANARKLQAWFRATVILLGCWILGLFLPLPDLLAYIFSFCLLGAFIASIGAIVYAYRVQSRLNQLGFSRTGAWVIAVSPFLISPLLVGIIASLAVLSNVKKIARRLEEGSLAMPAEVTGPQEVS